MIQEYLNFQFIKIKEDADVEKLQKVCADIVKKMGKDKAKILRYALIAFDPEIPADNPEIAEIKNLIIETWQTFLPNSKDTNLTIIRAVMLEVLQTVSRETSSACIIWFAIRNVIKHYKLGREEEILTKFLLELGNKIEKEVTESWSFSPDKEIEIPKLIPATVDSNELTPLLQANPMNGTGFAETINKALKKQVTEIKESQKTFLYLNSLMQMRTQLLWWKESGYSLSFKDSYKKLNEGALQVTLAFDYSSFIPEMYPISVDYFLSETHKSYTANGEKRDAISDLLKMIEQEKPTLKNIIPEYKGGEDRISLMNFIQGLVHGKFQVKQFKGLVGVANTAKITLNELTLWLFHDLHCTKLLTGK